MLYEGECLECAGVGAHLDESGECVCAENADFNDDNVCECIENYLVSRFISESIIHIKWTSFP